MKGFDSIVVKDINEGFGGTHQHVTPISASSTFKYTSVEHAQKVFRGEENAFIYSRWSNPTVEEVETKLAKIAVHGGEVKANCLLFSSGMAAISSCLLSLLNAGDKILSQGNLYGASTELMLNLLPEKGIEHQFINLSDLDQVESEFKRDDSYKLLYAETPSNPTLNCYDIKTLAHLCDQYGKYLVVDNTFATPYLQQPLLLGAHITVHSTTKFLNGHGNGLGGAIIYRSNEKLSQKLWNTRKLLGPVCSPFEAWNLNNGLKTLSMRMDRHCKNAMIIAEFLDRDDRVSKVNYLGLDSHPEHAIACRQMKKFGGVLSFELSGGYEAGFQMMKDISFCTLTASLGTADTLIQHPASMTHVNVPVDQRRKFGISDGLIRLSVGLETVEDVIADLDQAMPK